MTTLKAEQISLKQLVLTKDTASILLGLTEKKDDGDKAIYQNPRVDSLLRRNNDDIPDTSKIPELPALILPGQHASKKLQQQQQLQADSGQDHTHLMDGIDYDLLGKDRSTCSASELDQIRRERNRMHAKRTRDRKRILSEAMTDMSRLLEEENSLLVQHLQQIDPEFVYKPPDLPEVSPTLQPQMPPTSPPRISSKATKSLASPKRKAPKRPQTILDLTITEGQHGQAPKLQEHNLPEQEASKALVQDHLQTLLKVAGSFLKPSHAVSDEEGGRPLKRVCTEQPA